MSLAAAREQAMADELRAAAATRRADVAERDSEEARGQLCLEVERRGVLEAEVYQAHEERDQLVDKVTQ